MATEKDNGNNNNDENDNNNDGCWAGLPGCTNNPDMITMMITSAP